MTITTSTIIDKYLPLDTKDKVIELITIGFKDILITDLIKTRILHTLAFKEYRPLVKVHIKLHNKQIHKCGSQQPVDFVDDTDKTEYLTTQFSDTTECNKVLIDEQGQQKLKIRTRHVILNDSSIVKVVEKDGNVSYDAPMQETDSNHKSTEHQPLEAKSVQNQPENLKPTNKTPAAKSFYKAIGKNQIYECKICRKYKARKANKLVWHCIINHHAGTVGYIESHWDEFFEIVKLNDSKKSRIGLSYPLPKFSQTDDKMPFDWIKQHNALYHPLGKNWV